MNIFDIIGPVMVGPSSSHTAGAVRIGNIAGKLMGEKIVEANIFFHGSFLATGKGHGTDKALVAGLLGFEVDDIRIPQSFAYAEQQEMKFTIEGTDLGEVHPNTVRIVLKGENQGQLEVIGASIGGGAVEIKAIDGLPTNFTGNYPTLIVRNMDQPGLVGSVADILSRANVNIANMQLYRATRGGDALMLMECDQQIEEQIISQISNQEGVVKVTYLNMRV